jgi:predicted dehydrogenase
MSSEELRVGVIGVGYWGSKHVRALHSVEAVDQIVAIDSSAERVAALQRTFPRLEGYASLAAALDHVDAVVIATPPSTHCPLALEAMAAGKHVMVEKPMAVTSAEARLMNAAADANDVVLMVGHTFEYHSAVWKLREMVQSKELGRLHYLDTARLNLGLYQNDANVVFDLAPHDISILNYVLGEAPVSVKCWASRHGHRRFEDVAYLRLCYEDPQVFSNIHVSWLDPCKVRRVTVVGSEKMVVFNDLSSEERIRVYDKGVNEQLQDEDNVGQVPMTYRYGDVVAPYLTMNEPLLVEDQHFVDCVLTGLHPLTDGQNGLAVVEVLECAQISLDENRSVRIDEVRDDGGLVLAGAAPVIGVEGGGTR